MNKLIMLSILCTSISGCGNDGDDSSEIINNVSGYPNVSGQYSFDTSTISVLCSDGSETINPAISLNFDITQNVNELVFLNTNTSGGGVAGITIISSTGTSGNIEKNASFIVTQISTATIDGISGVVDLDYNISGDFTNSGWSGTYVYSVSTESMGACTFNSTFTGTKSETIGLTKQLLKYQNERESYPVDIYDPFGSIGVSIGGSQ